MIEDYDDEILDEPIENGDPLNRDNSTDGQDFKDYDLGEDFEDKDFEEEDDEEIGYETAADSEYSEEKEAAELKIGETPKDNIGSAVDIKDSDKNSDFHNNLPLPNYGKATIGAVKGPLKKGGEKVVNYESIPPFKNLNPDQFENFLSFIASNLTTPISVKKYGKQTYRVIWGKYNVIDFEYELDDKWNIFLINAVRHFQSEESNIPQKTNPVKLKNIFMVIIFMKKTILRIN